MSLKAYEENDIRNIANSIRNKGQSGTFTVNQMAPAIDNIQTGGSYGTLNVTTNGVYNDPSPYDAWNQVNVQVPGAFAYNGILEDKVVNQNFWASIKTAAGWRNGQSIIDIKGISPNVTELDFSGNVSILVENPNAAGIENYLYNILSNSVSSISFNRADIMRGILAYYNSQSGYYASVVTPIKAWCGPNVINMYRAYRNCYVNTIVCGPNVKDFSEAFYWCNKIDTEMTDTLTGVCSYGSFTGVPTWIVNIPYIEVKFENDRTNYGGYQFYLDPVNTAGGVLISNFFGTAPGGSSSYLLFGNIFGNIWFNNFVMLNRYSSINKIKSNYVVLDKCHTNQYSGSVDVVFSDWGEANKNRTVLTNILFTPYSWNGDDPEIGYRDLNWLCNNTRNNVVWESGSFDFTVDINKHYRNNNVDVLMHQCNFHANLKANIADYNLDVYFGDVTGGF